MKILRAAKKAAGLVAKGLVSKACWVWEKRTLFLPSALVWRKKWWGRPTAVILTAISMVAFLGLAAPAFAEIGSGYVYPAFAYLLEAISALIGQLLLWAIDLLIQISKYNSFLNANVVSIGWVLVRDVANMFFILIMLVIAFGTMLKIEAYSWKKLLPRLILTALLVNFSKTFIGLLIDFSQVIMLTFVNGYAAAAGANFLHMFQIENLFKSYQKTSEQIDVSLGGNVPFQVLMGFALGTIMLGISLIVILVFVAILLFRIITLWILIVLSPLAFLLGTFPKGQEYYGQWWKQLQGQIIVGPMVAFFLWLSLAALGGGENNAQISYDSTQNKDLVTFSASAPSLDTGTQAGKWDNIASFAISIAMLLMSLQMIQQLGVAGAGLASGALSTIKSKATAAAKKLAVPAALGLGVPIAPVLGLGAGYGAAWLGKKGVKWGAESLWTKTKTRFYDSKLGAIPSWFTYGEEHRKKELERAKEYADARTKTRHERKHHGFSPDYERLAKLSREMDKAKKLEVQFDDSVYAALTAGEAWVKKFEEEGKFSPEEAGAHRGVSRAIFNAAYIDDMMDGDGEKFDKIRAVLLHDVGVKKADGTIDEEAEETKRMRRTKSTENYRKLIMRGLTGNTKEVDDVLWRSNAEWQQLKQTNEGKYNEDRARIAKWSEGHQAELGLLADMKDVAKKTGHYENMGMARYDSATGKYSAATIEDQIATISTDLAKYGLVDKAKINPHSLMQLLGYDKNNPDGMTELGRWIYSSWMQGMDETNLSRNLLGRTANNMLGFGPREEPLKSITSADEGGWVQLNGDYVESKNGSAALRTFFSNPLLLRGLYSKVTGLGGVDISKNADKFKFVVGDVEVSLKEISDAQGDIARVVAGKRADNKVLSTETKEEVDYQKEAVAYEKRRSDAQARGAEFNEPPPNPPMRSVSEEKATNVAEQEIENLISDVQARGPAVVAPEVPAADLQAAVSGLKASADEAGKALESVVQQLGGLKDIGRIVGELSRIKNLKDTTSGQPTMQANVALLLQQLVNKNEQIRQILLHLEPAKTFKKKKK